MKVFLINSELGYAEEYCFSTRDKAQKYCDFINGIGVDFCPTEEGSMNFCSVAEVIIDETEGYDKERFEEYLKNTVNL